MSENNNSLEWGKLILPLLVTLLIGSEGWQYYAAPDKIKADTEAHVDNIAVHKLEKKIDSIAQSLVNKEYAKGILEEATAEIKGLNGLGAKSYLNDVFKVADEAIKNDSAWRYQQRPFILWLITNEEQLKHLFKYDYLAPMRNKETKKLEFNWLDGTYPITEKKVNGGIIRKWRDSSDDQHSLISISNIKDR